MAPRPWKRIAHSQGAIARGERDDLRRGERGAADQQFDLVARDGAGRAEADAEGRARYGFGDVEEAVGKLCRALLDR